MDPGNPAKWQELLDGHDDKAIIHSTAAPNHLVELYSGPITPDIAKMNEHAETLEKERRNGAETALGAGCIPSGRPPKDPITPSVRTLTILLAHKATN